MLENYSMLEKFEVSAWYRERGDKDGNKYHHVWGGSSLIKAIYHAWKAKAYSGCVKIEWRGTR